MDNGRTSINETRGKIFLLPYLPWPTFLLLGGNRGRWRIASCTAYRPNSLCLLQSLRDLGLSERPTYTTKHYEGDGVARFDEAAVASGWIGVLARAAVDRVCKTLRAHIDAQGDDVVALNDAPDAGGKIRVTLSRYHRDTGEMYFSCQDCVSVALSHILL
jgi:hypothetical protein